MDEEQSDYFQFNVEVGRTIKVHRLRLTLTQSDLAERLGVSQQQVFKYEQGQSRIPADNMFVLCKMLDIDPSKLLAKISPSVKRIPKKSLTLTDSEVLTTALKRVSDRRVRKKVVQLIESLMPPLVPPDNPDQT